LMLQRNGFALPFVILSLLYQQILSLSGDGHFREFSTIPHP
jgi:hypothetical protein